MKDPVVSELEKWLQEKQFQGWDPFDALNSPLARVLSLGTHAGRTLWVQLLKRLPWNIRPLLGIRPQHNPKGMGLLLAAYTRKYRLTGNDADAAQASELARWLLENGSSRYGGLGWGYHFPWPNRAFYCPPGVPTVVNTAFCGLALLDAASTFDNRDFLAGATAAAEFALHGLNVSAGEENSECASYTPVDHSCVHNANLLGATLLIQVGAATNNGKLLETGRRRIGFALSRQAPDGSWPYGTAANQRWVDSFHTGYNLVALEEASALLPGDPYRKALEKGYAFYREHFFLPDGTVKYYHDRVYPLDAHAFAHALITLHIFRKYDKTAAALRDRVREKLVELFRAPEGYFYYQRGQRRVNRIPYLRWVEVWVFHALLRILEP